MREVVFDSETTGLSSVEDRVVEIGCVELIDHIPTGRTFHVHINPQRDMPKEAERIHGLSAEFLKRKPTFRRIVRRFLDFIGDDPLVAHNADFDVRMINAELARLELPPLANEIIDTLPLARTVKPGGKHNLDALCRHFKIDNSKRDIHGALVDSELLAAVYLELRGGRQSGLDLSIVEKVEECIAPDYSRRTPPPPRITQAERDAHAAFVSSLGPNAVWADTVTEETLSEKAA
jgi:DNA polymerase III subunit epsilon